MQVIRNGILLMLIMIMCSGCALLVGAAIGGGAGVGATKYVKGEMEGSYAATMETTWVACQNALKEVGIEINGSIKEKPTHWMLEGRSEGGKEVKVTLDALSDKVTKVSVRVGIFGDEQLSKKINDAISRRLGSGRASNSRPKEYRPTAGNVAYVKVSKANIRSGPGTQHGVINAASEGDNLELIEEKASWCHVKLSDGSTGWIYKDLISR